MCELRSERSVRWRLPLFVRLLTGGHRGSSFPVMPRDLGVDECFGRCIGFRDESCFCGGGDSVSVRFRVGDGKEIGWRWTVEVWKG
jgi:hypothetical protein